MVIVSAELDRLIHEKRSQLRDAFAECRKARDAFSNQPAHGAELQRLESEERAVADRFHAISGELAQLHREKFGEYLFPWRGRHPSPR